MLRKSWKLPANDPSAEVPDVVLAAVLVAPLAFFALAAAVAAADGVTVLVMLMIWKSLGCDVDGAAGQQAGDGLGRGEAEAGGRIRLVGSAGCLTSLAAVGVAPTMVAHASLGARALALPIAAVGQAAAAILRLAACRRRGDALGGRHMEAERPSLSGNASTVERLM